MRFRFLRTALPMLLVATSLSAASARAEDLSRADRAPPQNQSANPPVSGVDACDCAGMMSPDRAWDMLAGGVPTNGHLFQLEISNWSRAGLAYHHSMGHVFSVGLYVSTDFAFFRPTNAQWDAPGFVLGVPLRLSIVNSDDNSFGLHATPGFGYFLYVTTGGSPPTTATTATWAASIDVALNYGRWLKKRVFMIGLGVSVPAVLAIRNNLFTPVIPLLGGAIIEYHIANNITVTGEAKFGPSFEPNNFRVVFAQRIAFSAVFGF